MTTSARSVHLLDIIPIQELQKIQDSFAAITSSASVIIDAEFNRLTQPSSELPFCQLMRSTPGTIQNCNSSCRRLAEMAAEQQQPMVSTCSNLSLCIAAIPLSVDNIPLGTWILSHCKTENLPEATVKSFASQYGLEETALLEAYKATPTFTTDQVIRDSKFLSFFLGHMFWDSLYKNYQLSLAHEKASITANLLQTVMSSVRTVIYVSDPQTSEIVFTNDFTEKLLAYDPTGKKCHEVFQKLDAPCSFCPRPKLLEMEKVGDVPSLSWEFHNPTMKRDFSLVDRLITWGDGRVLHLEIATDVTERKALLVSEAANVAKRNFLAHMTHELRTPMNGILGMTHLALQADPSPKQKEFLVKIKSSADVLLGIINDILDFSKIEAGKTELNNQAFSLTKVLQNCRELLTPKAREKGIGLSISVDPKVPQALFGDPQRLTQILLNLLSNAVKFTLHGGVTLNVHMLSLPGADSIKLSFTVQDTGIGMTPEEQATLFSAFSQANNTVEHTFGGTGLGLSISQRLAEMMGGTIRVTSEKGKGSTFTASLNFLMVEEDINFSALSEDFCPIEPESIKHARILMVEDNPINQEIGLEILTQAGALVTLANNGQQALDILFSNTIHFDLVLMDVQMPVMDGYTATEHIRSRPEYADLPIIAMTAHAFTENREDCLAKGMNDHIAKPFDVNMFFAVLDRWLPQVATSRDNA